MKPGAPEQARVSLRDVADVLAAIAGIVLVIAGLTVAIVFTAVLLADLIARLQLVEARAMELLVVKVDLLKSLLP